MEQSTLNVKSNSDDKKKFEQFCNMTGMNVSTAINLFIKTVLREQKLPFEIKTYSFDEEVYYKIKEAEEEMKHNNVRYTHDEILKDMKEIIN